MIHIAFLMKQFCQIISETQTEFFLIFEVYAHQKMLKGMEVFESQKCM